MFFKNVILALWDLSLFFSHLLLSLQKKYFSPFHLWYDTWIFEEAYKAMNETLRIQQAESQGIILSVYFWVNVVHASKKMISRAKASFPHMQLLMCPQFWPVQTVRLGMPHLYQPPATPVLFLHLFSSPALLSLPKPKPDHLSTAVSLSGSLRGLASTSLQAAAKISSAAKSKVLRILCLNLAQQACGQIPVPADKAMDTNTAFPWALRRLNALISIGKEHSGTYWKKQAWGSGAQIKPYKFRCLLNNKIPFSALSLSQEGFTALHALFWSYCSFT